MIPFGIAFNLDTGILFLMLLVAVAVIAAKDLVVSTILLSIFSLLMAAEYLVMGAVDVAITEAAVGAGISTILFLLALFLVGDKEKKSNGNFIVALGAVGLVTLGLIYTSFEMPQYGSKSAPSQMHISPYYLENAYSETGVPNVVTAVLASYRGYDTMGEATVIFAAAIAIMLLLGRFIKDGNKNG